VPRYVIWVEFEIKPESFAAFMPLMLANAKASLNDEPGCHQFDVLTPTDKANAVALYEIYTDRAAFDVHLKTPHFLAFDKATAAMLASKRVSAFTLE
jgi:(4S)-4-hydroxy-5-phosphonooxypentane-2,3-dione isomerase